MYRPRLGICWDICWDTVCAGCAISCLGHSRFLCWIRASPALKFRFKDSVFPESHRAALENMDKVRLISFTYRLFLRLDTGSADAPTSERITGTTPNLSMILIDLRGLTGSTAHKLGWELLLKALNLVRLISLCKRYCLTLTNLQVCPI